MLNWLSISREGFWGGLGVSTGVCKYICTIQYLFIIIIIYFKIIIVPSLFSDFLYSGGDIYMIFNKDNIQKCGWSLCGMKSSGGWVSNFWSCWPTGQPVGGLTYVFTKSNPLANGWPVGQELLDGSTRWPTPYNWRVGYNRSAQRNFYLGCISLHLRLGLRQHHSAIPSHKLFYGILLPLSAPSQQLSPAPTDQFMFADL